MVDARFPWSISHQPSGRRALDAQLGHQRARQAARADEARADVRADDRADLADEDRLGAEDLTAARDELRGLLVGLDVLDAPPVGAVLLARLEVVDHALERAPGGADALDRRDLAVDRQDRLDLQRAAQPRLRGADAPAALEELQR